MEENKQEFAYLITHMPGFAIDGITYDEESAKYLVDTLNKRYERSMKCFHCKLSHFKYGEEKCGNAEIKHGDTGCYCTNDVNKHEKFLQQYDYQEISVIDVNKMLGEC